MPDGYGELTPDLYLEILESWLLYQWRIGKIESKSRMRDEFQRAQEMVDAGSPIWSLPHFDELVGVEKYFKGTQPEVTPEMTPYQQWQVQKYYAEQAGKQREQAWELRGTKQALEQAKVAARTQAFWTTERERRAEELSKGQKRRVFEHARQQILGEAAGPRDWITRWQAEHAINPYERREPGVFGALEERRERGPSMLGPTEQFGPGTLGAFRRGVAFQESVAGLEASAAKKRKGKWGGGKGKIATWKAGPPTPPWLARMYPSLGTHLGRPEQATPGVPSGQAWARLTPSQRAGWAGFAEWGGQTPEDLLAQMQMMLPRTPQRTRGWRPARQRVMI